MKATELQKEKRIPVLKGQKFSINKRNLLNGKNNVFFVYQLP